MLQGAVVALSLFFFCQAEDGIRYLVRSRGLGDVYKRQAQDGVHEQFFPGGQVKHRGTYVRGLGDGTFTWYLSLIHI